MSYQLCKCCSREDECVHREGRSSVFQCEEFEGCTAAPGREKTSRSSGGRKSIWRAAGRGAAVAGGNRRGSV